MRISGGSGGSGGHSELGRDEYRETEMILTGHCDGSVICVIYDPLSELYFKLMVSTRYTVLLYTCSYLESVLSSFYTIEYTNGLCVPVGVDLRV